MLWDGTRRVCGDLLWTSASQIVTTIPFSNIHSDDQRTLSLSALNIGVQSPRILIETIIHLVLFSTTLSNEFNLLVHSV
jgi:hypothetical protein